MTSANVTYYRILDKSGKEIGEHSHSHYCKFRWLGLLKYIPLEDHQIQAYWYDEDEEYYEDEPIGLMDFLTKVAKNGIL